MPHKLRIYGAIGGFWGLDVESLISEIHDVEDGEPIDTHINSEGGIAFDGVAIFNALRQHDGEVNVYVDGLAASAASIIAMAGDTVEMGLGTQMMIHSPWMLTMGDAGDHRESADMLDGLQDSLVEVYEDKTDLDADELHDKLDAETWMSAEEAVEEGFADRVNKNTDEEDASDRMARLDFSDFQNVPAGLRERVARAAQKRMPAAAMATTNGQGNTMPKENDDNQSQGQNSQPAQGSGDGGNDGGDVVDLEKARAEARADEAKRRKSIRRAVATADLGSEFADELVDETSDDGQPLNLEGAVERIHERKAELQKTPSSTNAVESITRGTDERDKFRGACENAILARAGRADPEDGNPYLSFKLVEMARKSAQIAGARSTRINSIRDVAGAGFQPQAYGGASTSDFPAILENVVEKSLFRGWEEAAETFGTWTRTGSLPDYKPGKRVGLNLFDDLEEVPEGGEYEHGELTDRAESIALAKYGRLFALTREAIINDDIQAFTMVPMRMGRAAARTVGNLAYGVLTGNQELASGNGVFSSTNHNNSSSDTLDVDALDKARTRMRTQKDPDDKASGGLNIIPRFLLVPAALEGQARRLMESEFRPGGNNNDINEVRGMADIVVDARLDADSTTIWYLFADPDLYDTVEVAYLNGQSAPELEQKEGWTVDGIEWKIRQDAGVKALDYRGMYRGGNT